VAEVEQSVAAVNPAQPVSLIQTMDTAVSDAVAEPRFNFTLLSLFAAAAITLL
jgi:hypothetical protein